MTVVRCLTCEEVFVTASKLNNNSETVCLLCGAKGKYVESVNPIYKGEGVLIGLSPLYKREKEFIDHFGV